MPRTPKSTDTTTTTEPTLSPEQEALLASIGAALASADALTPKTRSKGEPKNRNYFDTEAILKAASELPEGSDYLALLGALGIDDDDSLIGPKIRTRLSQLCNTKRLPSNFRPIKPKAKPLYLAQKNAASLIAAAIAAGIDPAMIPGTPEHTAANEPQEANETA